MDFRQQTLWNRNYLLLLAGQWVSQIGNAAYMVALPLYVLKLTDSPLMLGLVMTAAMVPFTLLGPFAGVLCDRWSRKHVIVLSDFISGMLVLVVGWLAWQGVMSISILVITAVLLSICSSFFMPASMAAIPNLVPRDRLTRAMALFNSARHISLIIGPALGAVLILWIGFPGAFLINGLSFLISALSESFMHIPHKRQSHPFFFGQELSRGWSYIVNHRTLLAIACVIMAANLVEPAIIPVVMPVVIRDLGVPLANYGGIRALFGVGSLLAAGLLILGKEQKNKSWLIVGSMVSIGVFFVGLGLATTYAMMLVLIALYGVAAGIGNTMVMVEIQSMIPDEMRARVFGVVAALSAAMMPISYTAIGWALGIIPAGSVLVVAAIVITLGAVAYYVVRPKAEAPVSADN